MKRILFSLLTVGVVGATAFAASQAFFSDTETSIGNTFTAGGLNLKIDSTAHYDGLICNADHKWADESGGKSSRPDLIGKDCDGTWIAKDLDKEKFFNLADVKPGDQGENTISLAVDNDAWACVRIDNMQNNENSCTDPEKKAGDITCGTGPDQGELAQNLYFTAWADNGNNIWDPEEPLLFANKFGPASDVLNGKTYALADSAHPERKLLAGKPSFIGLQWCAGLMDVDIKNHKITCDGSKMGNDTQTDSVSADIHFIVEQARNNPNFRCGAPTNITPTPIPTGSVLDYLNIGDTTSEATHSLGDWSNAWVNPGWGGVYGGGSSDNSFRLLLGKGDGCLDADKSATFVMHADGSNATKLTLEHLDGLVNDSFDVLVNGSPFLNNHYTAGNSGTESWKITTFTFPGTPGDITFTLTATNEVGSWCEQWGQVAFSNAKLE